MIPTDIKWNDLIDFLKMSKDLNYSLTLDRDTKGNTIINLDDNSLTVHNLISWLNRTEKCQHCGHEKKVRE